jgi:hypothetical protein
MFGHGSDDPNPVGRFLRRPEWIERAQKGERGFNQGCGDGALNGCFEEILEHRIRSRLEATGARLGFHAAAPSIVTG